MPSTGAGFVQQGDTPSHIRMVMASIHAQANKGYDVHSLQEILQLAASDDELNPDERRVFGHILEQAETLSREEEIKQFVAQLRQRHRL